MFTDAQIQYIEEVLGASVSVFRGATEISTLSPAVLVLTPHLNLEEKTLLTKVLLSAKLSSYEHREATDPTDEIAQSGTLTLTPTPTPTHILSFSGGEAFGRDDRGQAIWWNLPLLSEMLGQSPHVLEKKKSAWALLQEFMKEQGTLMKEHS